MPTFITSNQLAERIGRNAAPMTLIDVRKQPAWLESGLTIPGAIYRNPEKVSQWWADYSGKPVIVFCVHGHEVSQGVCSFLAAKGIGATCLEGGFEGWRSAGGAVVTAKTGS